MSFAKMFKKIQIFPIKIIETGDIHRFLPLLVIVLLLLAIAYLYGENIALRYKLADLNVMYEALLFQNEELTEKMRSAESNISYLEEQLDECVDSYKFLESEYNELIEASYDLNTVTFYLLTWIKGNSELNAEEWDDVVRPCVRYSLKYGYYVNLPCVPWRGHFQYVQDPEQDRISSISEFLFNRKGDCEDYALFMAAVVRSAIERNMWIMVGKSGDGVLWLSSRWYYPRSEPVYVRPLDVYLYCGKEHVEDENAHCIIAVQNNKGGTFYVEPQDGFLYDEDPFESPTELITSDDYIIYTDSNSLSLKQSLQHLLSLISEIK